MRGPSRVGAKSTITLAAFVGMSAAPRAAIARVRLETISFFLIVLLLSAAAVMGLWNWLRRDFVKLPRLGYGQSVALVSLWGMLFLLVLTMISGARELLTPGAWEKDGATYKLTKGSGDDGKDRKVTEAMRRERLANLKAALWTYAAAHGGALPADDRDPAIPAELWQTPDLSRARYPLRRRAQGGRRRRRRRVRADGVHRPALLPHQRWRDRVRGG